MSQQQNRSHKVIQYYLDPERKERAPTDDNGNLQLNFGTCLQGTEARIKLWAANTIEFPIQLEPIIADNEPDLKITKYPPILQAGAIGEVIVSFKPDSDRVSPLQSSWDFRKIILTKT